MNYLIPAWHKQLKDWSFSTPQIEFDDAVSHYQLFKAAKKKIGLVITDYLPQLITQLDKLSVYPDRLFSLFDYLQGISTTDSKMFDYQDLNWPAGVYFDYTNFRIIAMVKENPYAKVIFDTQGRVLRIDYLNKQGQIDYQLIIDSRGFISSKVQGSTVTYYDNFGRWRFRYQQSTDHVTINSQWPAFTRYLEYDHLKDLLEEVWADHFCPQFHNQDQVVITLDDQATIDLLDLKLPHSVYSASHWYPYHETIKHLKTGQIVVESEKEAEKVAPFLANEVALTTIPLFQSRFKLGHSQRIKQQKVAIFAEHLDHDQLTMIIDVLYPRLLAKPATEGVYIYTYSIKQQQMVEQVVKMFRAAHQGEFVFSTEVGQQGENNFDDKPQLPALTVVTKRLTSEAEVLTAFDSVRLLINWGKPDQFLKMVAVSVGIPQLTNTKSEELVDRQNGIICHNKNDLQAGIEYYLDSLANWNQALVYNVKMLNRYAVDSLLKQWTKVLGGNHD